MQRLRKNAAHLIILARSDVKCIISPNPAPLRCTCARNSIYARSKQLHSIPRSSQIGIMWAFLHNMGRIQLCAVIHYERAYDRIRRKSLNMFAFGTKPLAIRLYIFLTLVKLH